MLISDSYFWFVFVCTLFVPLCCCVQLKFPHVGINKGTSYLFLSYLIWHILYILYIIFCPPGSTELILVNSCLSFLTTLVSSLYIFTTVVGGPTKCKTFLSKCSFKSCVRVRIKKYCSHIVIGCHTLSNTYCPWLVMSLVIPPTQHPII